MMFHALLLSLALTLLLVGQLDAQREKRKVITHFGNCLTGDYGPGRCIYRKDCHFYSLELLDAASKQHCYAQQRPELVCCPNVENVLPLLAARIDNNTAPITTTPATPTGGQLAQLRPPALATADELPRHPHCGTSFAFKVYGGNVTGLLEFPWTTLLEYTVVANGQKRHDCGAAFIAQRWLLTAAHCVHKYFLGDGRLLTGARVGEWEKSTNPDCVTTWNGKRECVPPHIQARIDRQLIHPDFEVANLTHDIALLRLAQPIDWHSLPHVEPVCLPPVGGSGADQLVGSAVDVSGWGLTEHNNRPSTVKRKAMLYVESLEQCRPSYREQGYVLNPGQLCASGGVSVDSCLGDSGGPLTVEAYTPQRDRFVYLAGIVSYGKKNCGKTDFPGVYTRVSHYVDWIEQTIRNNSDSSDSSAGSKS